METTMNNLSRVNQNYDGPDTLSDAKKIELPEISTNLFNQSDLAFKRAMDLCGALIFFIFIGFWLFPIIAILIKLDSPGPVFFKQKREGLNNDVFKCYKFRSMVQNEDADSKQATKGDPRVTKIGRILRKTSIDELPQIINVLKGEMSLVGPRPHPINLNRKCAEEINGFMNRHWVKPGITGLAQAKGYRGETQTFHSMYFRYKLDMHYIKSWSIGFDVKIILMTVKSLITNNDNAY